VKTPAAAQGFSLKNNPRSLAPFYLIPAAIPAAKKPGTPSFRLKDFI
jgi:hypothetical protein